MTRLAFMRWIGSRAKGAGTTRQPGCPRAVLLAGRPPLWLGNVPLPELYLLALAASAWLGRARPWVLPGSRLTHRLLGCPLIVAGTILVVRSLEAAGQVDLGHPGRLVTTGPYAVSRNPMYAGWALLHLGAGVAAGSGWILAALPAAAGLVHWQVRCEEQDLGADFGDEFARYRAAVPRYLGPRSFHRQG